MSSNTANTSQAEWKFEAAVFPSSASKSPALPSTSHSSTDSTTPTFEAAAGPENKAQAGTNSNSQSHNVGFSFVNSYHPDDAKGSSNKRTIRSHVAKVQHSRTRASGSTSKNEPKEVKARTQSRPSRPQVNIRPKITEPEQSSSQISHSPALGGLRGLVTEDDDDDDVEELPPRSRHDSHYRDQSSATHNAGAVEKASFLHPATVTLLRILRGGRHDPFWTYPVPFHPHIERIVNHYLVHIAVDIPFIVPPTEPGLLRRKWFPLAMAEPATFYAIVLLAATHHAVVNPAYSNAFDLLTLKGKAISAINEALADPQRSISDSTMGAVMKMASYEAIFGDEKFFHAHMNGLQHMVQKRGGLPNLGLDGLLERIVLWIDSNYSHHLGCGWKFDKKWFPTTVLHPAVVDPNLADAEPSPTCATMALANGRAPPAAAPTMSMSVNPTPAAA
ncbi:hypothetical protein K461DRAFT_144943 [Myriangium duriaei CBS 260.36]|uniref:Uncharacterized protein n=1 Tax=Myriangium duriaei CBS 260.36 TaxID=1168546 RepID=A0A9P4J4Q0_9PEZI|nr:hypothetical protein K461DRAFT_144943 [Myriangium duriaei CBS 260.36]